MLLQQALQLAQGDTLHLVTGPGAVGLLLRAGCAELYGQPLSLGETYLIPPYTSTEVFSGAAELAIVGSPAYIRQIPRPHRHTNAQLLSLVERLNAHRDFALQNGNLGPIVAVIGSEAIARTLRNYSYRSSWLPTVLNLDRSGCHSQIEFLYQGPYVLQAALPDLVGQTTLQMLQTLEALPPVERITALAQSSCAPGDAPEPPPPLTEGRGRSFRDSEQTRVKLMSVLSSVARREAAAGKVEVDLAGGVESCQSAPVGGMGSDARLMDGVVLNAWESMFRRDVAGSEGGDLATGCFCVSALSMECTCGAAERLVQCVDAYLLNHMPAVLRAAGLILVVGDVGLAALATVRVDAVVYAGLESRVVMSQIEACWGDGELPRPPLTFLNTAAPPAASSGEAPPVIDRGVILQQRQKFLGAPRATTLSPYTRGQELEYITGMLMQQFHALYGIGFPFCQVIEPLPLRLCYGSLSVPGFQWKSDEELAGAVCLLPSSRPAVWVEVTLPDLAARVLALGLGAMTVTGFITYSSGREGTVLSSCLVNVSEQRVALAAMPTAQRLSTSFIVLRIPQIIIP